MARPPKDVTQYTERVCKVVKTGYYLSLAARYLGLDESTLYKWMEKGRTGKTGAYKQFYQAVKKAQAEFEIRCLGEIQRTDGGGQGQTQQGQGGGNRRRDAQWQRWAWLLCRVAPERWSTEGTGDRRDDQGRPPVALHLGFTEHERDPNHGEGDGDGKGG
jgi:hypothetical protein